MLSTVYYSGTMRTKSQQRKLRIFLLTKEVVMYTLVGFSFAFLALEHLERLSHEQLVAIEWFEVGLALFFITEFVFEWHYARDRRHYLKYHWFYLIAAVPVPTTSFEILRGIRLLRVLKLLKIFAHLRYERNTRLFE